MENLLNTLNPHSNAWVNIPTRFCAGAGNLKLVRDFSAPTDEHI